MLSFAGFPVTWASAEMMQQMRKLRKSVALAFIQPKEKRTDSPQPTQNWPYERNAQLRAEAPAENFPGGAKMNIYI